MYYIIHITSPHRVRQRKHIYTVTFETILSFTIVMFSRLCVVCSVIQSTACSNAAHDAFLSTQRTLVWHDQSTTCEFCAKLYSSGISFTLRLNGSCDTASANTIAHAISLVKRRKLRCDLLDSRWFQEFYACCLQRRTPTTAVYFQQTFYNPLIDDWRQAQSELTATLDTLLLNPVGESALRISSYIPPSSTSHVKNIQSCIVCNRVSVRCVCYCQRTLHSLKRSRRDNKLQRGLLASNVIVRAYMFANPRFSNYYKTQLVLHLA